MHECRLDRLGGGGGNGRWDVLTMGSSERSYRFAERLRYCEKHPICRDRHTYVYFVMESLNTNFKIN